MNKLLQDFRFAARQLRKSPGFALTTILTLALGIGATTAIFSLINTVLLKPLPFPEQERLMHVAVTDNKLNAPGTLSYPDFFDWRAQQQSFVGLAGHHDSSHNLVTTGPARHVEGQVVSSDFFRILRARPALGRDLTLEDEKSGVHNVILSHELWESALGSDPNVVGKPIQLDGTAYTVVGVMPKGFQFPVQQPAPQFWASVGEDATDPGGEPATVQRGAHWLDVVGRLKPGVTVDQAHADLAVISQRLADQYPKSNKRFNGAWVQPYLEHLIGDSKSALHLLFTAVSFVLLIACANVAGLMLARASGRRGEIALRAALGASRSEIIRQVLVEPVLLSLLGGVAGVLLASGMERALVHLLPQNMPRLSQVSLDGRVLLFTVAVSVMAGILAGVLPALRVSHLDPSAAMRDGGRSLTPGRHQHRLHSGLVVAETAIGLVLLVGSGLLIRSFIQMLHVDPGFQPQNVLTARIDIPYSDLNKFTHFYDELLPRLAALPGVQSAGAGFPLPLWNNGMRIGFDVEGHPSAVGESPSANVGIVTPSFFQALRIPLIAGRTFTAEDTEKAPLVVVVNQAFAQKYLPGEDPIGKIIEPGLSDGRSQGKRRIIGVVGNTKRSSLTAEMPPTYYMPLPQAVAISPAILLRTAGDPALLIGPSREQVAQIDRNIALYRVQTMGDYLSTATATPRFQTVLLTAFAGIALLLSAVGLYAILSYMVAQRTVEIGVRMALGAQRGTVLQLILRKGLALAALGLAIGIVLSLVLTRFMQNLLYGVKPFDALTFALVSGILISVALVASAAPALRAARLDPITTLREQ